MKFLIVEPFGGGTGHTVNFIQTLVDILSIHVEVTLWTTSKLCNQITGEVIKVPLIEHNAKKGILLRASIAKSLWLRDVTIYDAVFFSSFEELTMIFWGRKRGGKTTALITNNFSYFSRLKHLFFKIAMVNVSRMFLYSEKQKEFLIKKYNFCPINCHVIPHYSVGCQRNVTPKDFQLRKEIVFIGGSGRDKRLDKFINLITADKKQKYRYGLYGNLQLSEENKIILDQSNVNVVDRYLVRKEYFDILSKAKFVVLFYTQEFSYKISGIFFDAVSSYTPVIANNILSFTHFFDLFGPIGELVNCDQPRWEDEFLRRDLDGRYDQYLEHLAVMKKDLGHDKLIKMLLHDLNYPERG